MDEVASEVEEGFVSRQVDQCCSNRLDSSAAVSSFLSAALKLALWSSSRM